MRKNKGIGMMVLGMVLGFYANELGFGKVKTASDVHPNYAQQYFTVNKFIDGDTLTLSNGQHVRLIGVDAPERFESDKVRAMAKKLDLSLSIMLDLGLKSSQFIEQLVGNKEVRIEFGEEICDVFGRTLAYVYVKDSNGNETMLNQAMIATGYAAVMRRYSFSRKVEFLDIEAKAKQQNLGLWQEASFNALH